MEKRSYQVDLGRMSPHVRLRDYVIRYVREDSIDDDGQPRSTLSPIFQGHVTNICDAIVDDLVIDVSYYDADDRFLGFNKSGFLDIDELDAKQTIPIEIDLEIPESTVRCVINVAAKKMASGFFMRWFYRGKD